MTKTLRSIVVLATLFLANHLSAQAVLGVTIASFPQHPILGDSTNYTGSLWVHNYGNVGYMDSIRLQYSINGIVYNADIPDSGIYLSPDTIIVPPIDSAFKTITVRFNRTIFQNIGSSGVVIWPIGIGVTCDTSIAPIIVDYPAEVKTLSASDVKVYTAQHHLFINTTTPNLLCRVRIFDFEGQMLMEKEISSSSVIPMNNYSDGCYIVEVVGKDTFSRFFKVFSAG